MHNVFHVHAYNFACLLPGYPYAIVKLVFHIDMIVHADRSLGTLLMTSSPTHMTFSKPLNLIIVDMHNHVYIVALPCGECGGGNGRLGPLQNCLKKLITFICRMLNFIVALAVT